MAVRATLLAVGTVAADTNGVDHDSAIDVGNAVGDPNTAITADDSPGPVTRADGPDRSSEPETAANGDADGARRSSTGYDGDDRADDGPTTDRKAARAATEPVSCCSRRAVLAAAAGTAAVVAPVGGSKASGSSGSTLHVNVYTGPTPLYARLHDGLGGLMSDWTSVHAAATAAVEDALAQVASHAAATGRDWLDVAVDRGGSIGTGMTARSPIDALVSADRVYDRFRDVVAERRMDAACHLLLWWGPFDYEIGYGRTVPGHGRVAPGDGLGGLTVANIGATEHWDGRPVTRNMAIHEVLHTYLSSAAVSSVVESECDHDLGRVVEIDSGVREVSPMTTAYAGEAGGDGADWRAATAGLSDSLSSTSEGDTRWRGRGCVDHGAIAHHDGTTAVSSWTHTTTLSEETKEAVCRYAERSLA